MVFEHCRPCRTGPAMFSYSQTLLVLLSVWVSWRRFAAGNDFTAGWTRSSLETSQNPRWTEEVGKVGIPTPGRFQFSFQRGTLILFQAGSRFAFTYLETSQFISQYIYFNFPCRKQLIISVDRRSDRPKVSSEIKYKHIYFWENISSVCYFRILYTFSSENRMLLNLFIQVHLCY